MKTKMAKNEWGDKIAGNRVAETIYKFPCLLFYLTSISFD